MLPLRKGEAKSRFNVYTSPATLDASCKAAIYLESLLQPMKDRLTVLITNLLKFPDHKVIIIPLGPANMGTLESILSNIKLSTNKPNKRDSLKRSVARAECLLNESYSPRDRTEGTSYGIRGLVYVLTSNTKSFSAYIAFSHINQIDIISPGIIPWKSNKLGVVNRWKIAPTFADYDASFSDHHNENQSKMHENIRRSIDQACSSTSLAQLTDLTLKLKPTPCSVIQAVAGDLQINSLHLGEVVSLPVQIKLDAFDEALLTGSNDSPSRTAPILKGEIKFKNSHFPPSITVSARGDARVKLSPSTPLPRPSSAPRISKSAKSTTWQRTSPPQKPSGP